MCMRGVARWRSLCAQDSPSKIGMMDSVIALLRVSGGHDADGPSAPHPIAHHQKEAPGHPIAPP